MSPEKEQDDLDQIENDPVDENTDETLDDDIESEPTVDVPEEKEKEKKEVKSESAPEKRPVYTMPVAKAQEEKKRAVEKAREEARKEAQEELTRVREEYETKIKRTGGTASELEAVAKEYDLDPKAVDALFGAFKKNLPLPDLSKYDSLVKAQEIEHHKTRVSQDFDEKVAPLLLKDFPQATPEHIREVKKQIGELAFSEGFNTYRLEDIYKINRDQFEFKNSRSAESSGGRSGDLAEFKRLSDEDEIKLADNDSEAYGRYLKWLEGQESKYLD